jgi:hypothetical protein
VRENLVACLTAVYLDRGMSIWMICLLVRDQVTSIGKRFTTYVTLKRLFAGVEVDVLVQPGEHKKALSTDVAAILVFLEMALAVCGQS